MSTIEKALGALAPKANDKAEDQLDTVERAGSASDGGPGFQDRSAVVTETHGDGSPPPADGSLLTISFDELQQQGLMSPAVPRSSIAEEFRGIKRPLLKNIDGQAASRIDNANLIMVTSALQGDGKTFTSLNLAISIAMEQDRTVLFVDADVLRATAGRMLGVPSGSPGLIDLLDRRGVEPRDVIKRTNIPKLSVLPAGSPSEHATELLASDSMQRFMLELSARYPDRVIVFDSPPLLMTTEAGVLASFMGQIVFVASAGRTPQSAVKQAMEHIGPDKMVGMVLNRASRRGLKLFGYAYGYGYGYGYGSGYGNRDADRAAIEAASE